MQSHLFPNTLTGVIFQEGQFTPAMQGILSRIIPTESAQLAVRAALLGTRTVNRRALFFLNPRIADSNWITRNRIFSERIGNHDFYK